MTQRIYEQGHLNVKRVIFFSIIGHKTILPISVRVHTFYCMGCPCLYLLFVSMYICHITKKWCPCSYLKCLCSCPCTYKMSTTVSLTY
jgi:hypothetical protein